MKRMILALTLGLAAAGGAASAGAGGVRQVSAAESRWTRALVRRDAAVLERSLAAEYTLSGEPAVRPPVHRAEWLDNALHHMRLASARFETLQVDLHGARATARGVFVWKGVFRGEAFADRVALTDEWVKRDGRWQVISRRVSDAPPP